MRFTGMTAVPGLPRIVCILGRWIITLENEVFAEVLINPFGNITFVIAYSS